MHFTLSVKVIFKKLQKFMILERNTFQKTRMSSKM